MNNVIQTLLQHRSHVKFADQQVEDEKLELIAAAAQAAPSWINGQQVTMICVREPERKKQFAVLSGNQKHVEEAPVFLVFCADFYRAAIASEMEGTAFDAVNHTDVLLVGATDVGLAMGNAIAAAESLGLGIRPIGGIRKQALETAALLELPKYVIPIAGLCIGYAVDEPPLKPRLPKEAVLHEEVYNQQLHDLIASYNETYETYTQSQGGKGYRWTERIAGFYEKADYSGNYKDVGSMLKQQGFTCKVMR